MINLLKKIFVLSSAIVLVACGAANQGPGTTNADTTAPVVLKVSPSSLIAHNLLVNVNTITVQLSEPIAQSTLDALNSITIKSDKDYTLAGQWSFADTNNDKLIFTITSTPIPANEKFTIDINNIVKDLAGNALTKSPIIYFTSTTHLYNISVDAKGLEGDETVVVKETTSNSSSTLSATQLNGVIQTQLADGSDYTLSITAQPKTKSCTLKSASGKINGNDASATVVCQDVLPYYSDAPLWNDYHIISSNQLSVQGGVRRAVYLNGVTSCDNITAKDNLDVFSWSCEEEKTNNNVTAVKVVSTALKPGKGLSDLIQFSTTPSPAWKTNFVTIKNNGQTIKTTASAIWWNNPVLLVPTDSPQLSESNAIYVVVYQPIQISHFNIAAKGVSLVVNPQIALITQNGGIKVDASNDANRAYFWIEGKFDAQHKDSGITLNNTFYGRLNNVKVSNANGNGITINNCMQGIILNNVTALNSDANGLAIYNLLITKGYGVTVSNSIFSNNAASGVDLNTLYAQLLNINASSNKLNGISINTGNNMLSGIFAYNNGKSGILISGVHNNLLSSITATNNDEYGISLVNSNSDVPSYNNIYVATLANNKSGAIHNEDTSSTKFGDILSAYNDTACSVCENLLTIASSDMPIGDLFSPVSSDSKVSGNDYNSTDQSIFINKLSSYPTLESPFRSWGSYTLPTTDTATGSCLTDSQCKIYDWRLNANTKATNAIPAPVNTVDFNFAGGSKLTYLENAVEINTDAIGNNNGYCEQGETCVLVTNYGSYQGEGNLSDITDNAEANNLNITLKKYNTYAN